MNPSIIALHISFPVDSHDRKIFVLWKRHVYNCLLCFSIDSWARVKVISSRTILSNDDYFSLFDRSRRPKTVEIDPETGEKKGRKKNINSELLPLTRKGHGEFTFFFKYE